MEKNIFFSDWSQFNSIVKDFEVHQGGEGTVYENKVIAIKIFNPKQVNISRKQRKVERHIKQSEDLKFEDRIIPKKAIYVKGKFVGYTMRYVSNSVELNSAITKTYLMEEDLRFSLQIAIKLAQSVEEIHNTGMIIGDFHPGQILLQNRNIYFVDTDSWGWEHEKDQYGPDLKCITNYVDPMCRDFNRKDVYVNYYSKETDYYSLAVIIFELLTGYSPFIGEYVINPKMKVEIRARNKISILGEHDIILEKNEPWNIWMTEELRDTFKTIFETDKRFNIVEELSNQLLSLDYCKIHGTYYSSEYSRCPICSKNSKKQVYRPKISYAENIITPKEEIKIAYDHRTYLNNSGIVVFQNQNGEVIKTMNMHAGNVRTYFFETGDFVAEIRLMNGLKRILKGGSKAAYILIYKSGNLIKKTYVEDYETIKFSDMKIYYLDKEANTLRREVLISDTVKEEDFLEEDFEFSYAITKYSKYALVYLNQDNRIEVNINDFITYLPLQIPMIIKFDEISSLWIFISKGKNEQYYTIIFDKYCKMLFSTKDINYQNLNLHNGVFFNSTLCIPGRRKIVFIMPYVKGMLINNIITEKEIDVVDEDSMIEIEVEKGKNVLYTWKPNDAIYKFII